MAEKQEWERLIDESYDWHIAHRIMWFGVIVTCFVGPWVNWRYLLLNIIFVPFYLGFIYQEKRLVDRSLKAAAAAKEQEQ